MRNRSTTSFASYRSFELLKYLANNPATIQEILEFLTEIDPEHRKYSTITVYKYLHSLQALGIPFKKVNYKYVLEKLPFSFDFSNEDINAIKILSFCAENMPEAAVRNNFNEIIQLLVPKVSTKQRDYYKSIVVDNAEISKPYTNKEKELISLFEKFAKDRMKACITYYANKNTVKKVTVDLIEISYKNEKSYFKVSDSIKGQIILIGIKNVISIEQLSQKSRGIFIPTTVTYTIKDDLKKSYTLKEGERLASSSENSAVIVNKGEDKTELIRRLLGYCNLCKIETPKSYKDEIVSELDKMLKNYEE